MDLKKINNPIKIIVEGNNSDFVSVFEDHWFSDKQTYSAMKVEYGTEFLLDINALKQMLKDVMIFDDFAVTIKKSNNQYSVYFDKND